jgi:hypothetical protein
MAQLSSPRANVYSRVILLGTNEASEELAESKKEADFGDREDIQNVD